MVVPVKETSIAKSRLTGISPAVRRELALAFAADTVAAALRCPAIDRVVVVTNDDVAARRLAELGAETVPDTPDAGLNPAVAHAAADVRTSSADARVAVLSADLPALRPVDLAGLLGSALPPRWFVPDCAGDGTTMLGAAAPHDLAPAFGPHSRESHRASGAVELGDAALIRLRLDVDTATDLQTAIGLGTGQHTSAVLARVKAAPSAAS